MTLPHYKLISIHYSCLYDHDFVKESLNSILPHVERSFIIMTGRPFGDVKGVTYKDKWITWPKFEKARDKVLSINNSKIEIIDDYNYNPHTQQRRSYDVVRERCLFDEFMFIPPDCVFSVEDANKTFSIWRDFSAPLTNNNTLWSIIHQIETWKTPEWYVVRPRSSVTLCRMFGDKISWPIGGTMPSPQTYIPQTRVHNLGFSASYDTIYWKHLTSLAFSPIVAESPPNPDWFEEKWVNWHPVTNNKNLEPSLNCESGIVQAIPYDTRYLPDSIRKRLASGEWRTVW